MMLHCSNIRAASIERKVRSLHATAKHTGSALLIVATLGAITPQAFAAKEAACGGNFTFGAQLANGIIPASSLPSTISVTGKNVEFQIDSATMAVRNYTLTGAANPDRLTPTPLIVFESKTPDLRGAVLTSNIAVQLTEGGTVITRSGNGVTITLQALDCATGGIFQMEAERADGTSTDFTHVLGRSVFYFNNPNFGPRPRPFPSAPRAAPSPRPVLPSPSPPGSTLLPMSHRTSSVATAPRTPPN